MKKGKQIEQSGGYFTYDWDFTDINDYSDDVVKEIILTIEPGNVLAKQVKDYNQTGLSYKYLTTSNYIYSSERTGLIENEKNIWKHPPRSNLFQILELNPFPFIKSPFTIGTTWSWSLEIGQDWGDERWLKWSDSIVNTYLYTITDIQEIKTNLGNLKCYIIKSDAMSRIGTTKLTSFFNEKYGFVKMEYLNIDGSKLILDLHKVE